MSQSGTSQPTENLVDKLTVIAKNALVNWDLQGAELELIKYRENAVYKITDKTGKKFALRVHRLNYHSDAALQAECDWTASLTQYGISTPPVIDTNSGQCFAIVTGQGIEPRQCDLLGWVEGDPMGSIEEGVEGDIETLKRTYHTIGEIAAKLHNHADQWQRPDGFERHAWDEAGLTGETPFWGQYWKWPRLNDTEVKLFLDARSKLRRELTEFGKDDGKYGLIHADLLPENLLIDGDQINLIDFDDGGFGWRLYDLATVLFFQLGEDNFDDISEALISGYRQHRPLPEEHLEYLPSFFVARGLSICGWLYSRNEPDDVKDIIEDIKAGVIELLEDFVS